MSKAQLVITAVVLEGRSKSEVARDYDVSRYWVLTASARRCSGTTTLGAAGSGNGLSAVSGTQSP